ncbi:MAG: hypothetical protein FJX76_04105 [Armatimonadetes bacterium]|nr:hypothetical protein [Armatimonadota bacterium]
MNPVGLDDLIHEAAAAGATDVLFTPARDAGKLIVRAVGQTLASRVVPPAVLRQLSMEVGMRTGLPALLGGGPDTPQASVSSYKYEGTLIRVIATPTAAGPMLRLRLQPAAMLGEALEAFRAGRFGGNEVLRYLHSDSGVIFAAGVVSGGKTSALHHLAAHRKPSVVVSQAREFELGERHVRPTESWEDVLPALEDAPLVMLDEMDEWDKLALALRLARQRLVVASMAAPNMEAALRRLGGTLVDEPERTGDVIGLLRVGWRIEDQRRRPEYSWYPMQRFDKNRCACCGESFNGDCARCGNSASAEALAQIPRRVITDMRSPDGFRAGELIEPDAPGLDAARKLLHALARAEDPWN